MYLFDSSVPAPYTDKDTIQHFVLVGSSNMTSNASRIQWNDLYGVKDSRALYDQYNNVFCKMRTDKGFHRIPQELAHGRQVQHHLLAGQDRVDRSRTSASSTRSGATRAAAPESAAGP